MPGAYHGGVHARPRSCRIPALLCTGFNRPKHFSDPRSRPELQRSRKSSWQIEPGLARFPAPERPSAARSTSMSDQRPPDEMGAVLAGLRARGPAVRTANCPQETQWFEVAGGALGDEVATKLL